MAAFNSHDGADAHGIRAEVYVQTGTGTITAMEESGRNVRVLIKVEGFKHPVSGWLSMDDPIFEMVSAAHEQGRVIEYRVEAQRKKNVDRTTPIDDLRVNTDVARENTVLIFAGIDGTLSKEAVTNPAEDPHRGGRLPATGQDMQRNPSAAPAAGGFTADQALSALAKARQGGLPQSIVDATAALALTAGATVDQVLSAGVSEQAESAPRPVQRAYAAEAAPFVEFNTDGRLNLGSYTVQAAAGAESLAVSLMEDHNQALADAHNARVEAGEVEDGVLIDPDPVAFPQAAALARVFLDIADEVQTTVYGGGRPNRMANSHTRARSYVYDAIKHRHPIPFGGSEEARSEWRSAVVAESVDRFQRVARLVHPAPAQPEQQGEAQAPAEQTQQAETQTSADQPEQQAEAQAPAEQAAEVRHIGNDTQSRPHVPVEGEDGFEAPTAEIIERFKNLAQAAGFQAEPNSPLNVFLEHKFGVSVARKVHGPALDKLLSWYEAKGVAEAPAVFKAHVMRETAPAASA